MRDPLLRFRRGRRMPLVLTQRGGKRKDFFALFSPLPPGERGARRALPFASSASFRTADRPGGGPMKRLALFCALLAQTGCLSQFTSRLDRGNEHLVCIRGELAK